MNTLFLSSQESVVIIADVHKGSPRSRSARPLALVERYQAHSPHVIWAGDTFDTQYFWLAKHLELEDIWDATKLANQIYAARHIVLWGNHDRAHWHHRAMRALPPAVKQSTALRKAWQEFTSLFMSLHIRQMPDAVVLDDNTVVIHGHEWFADFIAWRLGVRFSIC